MRRLEITSSTTPWRPGSGPVVAFRATLPNKQCRIRSNPTRIVDYSGMFLIVLEDCLFSCCLKVYPLVTCTTSLFASHAPHCAGSLQLPEHEQLFCLHPRMMLLYLRLAVPLSLPVRPELTVKGHRISIDRMCLAGKQW